LRAWRTVPIPAASIDMLTMNSASSGVPPMDLTITTGKMRLMVMRKTCWNPRRRVAARGGSSSTT